MEEGESPCFTVRRQNFSQEETDVLVREVKARSVRISGTATNAPRPADAKAAWEEIAALVNQVCPDTLRTVPQCKKRFNDVRRRGKKRLAEHRRRIAVTGGGVDNRVVVKSEEAPASSHQPTFSIEGFGGIEVGIAVTR